MEDSKKVIHDILKREMNLTKNPKKVVLGGLS